MKRRGKVILSALLLGLALAIGSALAWGFTSAASGGFGTAEVFAMDEAEVLRAVLHDRNAGVQIRGLNLVAGDTYTLSFWLFNAVGSATVSVEWGQWPMFEDEALFIEGASALGEWVHHEVTFTALPGATDIQLGPNWNYRVAGDVYYLSGARITAGDGTVTVIAPGQMVGHWGTDVITLALAAAPAPTIEIRGERFSTAMTELVLEGRGLTSADIEPLRYMTNLTRLMLRWNAITDLQPLAGLTNLTELNLFDNQITDLSPLAGLTNLTWLSVTQNQVSNLQPLAGLTALEFLAVNFNQVSNLQPLANLTNVTELQLMNNGISDLQPLAGLTNVEILMLHENNISNLQPLAGLTNLRRVWLMGNQISSIEPMTNLTSLEWFFLGNNQISNIPPLEGMENLVSLTLDGNNISNIQPLAGLAGLTGFIELNLSGNSIGNIQPLAGLTALRWLFLQSNEITNVQPLAGLVNLEMVDLSYNPILDWSPVDHVNDVRGRGSLQPGFNMWVIPGRATIPALVAGRQAENHHTIAVELMNRGMEPVRITGVEHARGDAGFEIVRFDTEVIRPGRNGRIYVRPGAGMLGAAAGSEFAGEFYVRTDATVEHDPQFSVHFNVLAEDGVQLADSYNGFGVYHFDAGARDYDYLWMRLTNTGTVDLAWADIDVSLSNENSLTAWIPDWYTNNQPGLNIGEHFHLRLQIKPNLAPGLHETRVTISANEFKTDVMFFLVVNDPDPAAVKYRFIDSISVNRAEPGQPRVTTNHIHFNFRWPTYVDAPIAAENLRFYINEEDATDRIVIRNEGTVFGHGDRLWDDGYGDFYTGRYRYFWFDGDWDDGDLLTIEVHGVPGYNIITANRPVVLHYVPPTVQFRAVGNGTLTAHVRDGAPFDSGASFPVGTLIDFVATPAPGYTIAYWTHNGNRLEGFYITGPGWWLQEWGLDIVVTFKPMPAGNATISFWSNHWDFGTVSAIINGEAIFSNQTAPIGAEITFTATPNPGYRVAYWTYRGNRVTGLEARMPTLTRSVHEDGLWVGVTFERAPEGLWILADPGSMEITNRATAEVRFAIHVGNMIPNGSFEVRRGPAGATNGIHIDGLPPGIGIYGTVHTDAQGNGSGIITLRMNTPMAHTTAENQAELLRIARGMFGG